MPACPTAPASSLFEERCSYQSILIISIQTLSLARRDQDVPGFIINPKTHMAWRPYENLIDGELDNQTPGKVSGWMRFFRAKSSPLRVNFDLEGDFHED